MKRWITNTGVLQIFGTLLLIIALMFVSNYYVYKSSISGIYDQVTENNALAVKSTIQSFDNSFRTLNNVIYSIQGLPYNSLYADDGTIDMTRVFNLQESVATLVSSIDFIEDVIVFYDDTDLAITLRGTSSFNHLFNGRYVDSMTDANYWRAHFRSKSPFKLFAARNYTVVPEDPRQKKTARYMVAASGSKIRLSNKNVIVLINEETFKKQINQTALLPGASMIVLDQDRNMILSTAENSWDLVEVLNDVYFNSSREGSLQKDNFEYNFYKSEFNGYIYIDKVPYQFRNIDAVAEANRTILLSTIVGAVLLAMFLSFYLNNPVKKIVRQLGGGISKGNDFRKIHSGIVKLQQEIESYKKVLSANDEEARRSAFLQVTDEYVYDAAQDEGMHRHFPQFFRYKQFALILLHLNDAARNEEERLSARELSVLIEKRISEYHSSVHVFYENGLRMVACVGIESQGERERLIKRLGASLTQLEELTGYSMIASVSEPYAPEIVNCKRAFREVENGFNFRVVDDSIKVLDVAKIDYRWTHHFPLEQIEKITNHVMGGKWQEARDVISETMQANAEQQIHHHQLAHIARTIFYYLVRPVEVGANVQEQLYELELSFMQKVRHAHDYREVENALLDATKQIAKMAAISPEKNSKLNPAFILQYIALHYMENLYLDQMAEVAGTSPKYFSNYFKKTFGVNYVEYLNKVRLSHARELLKETALSIAEIGDRTGYLNSSTFTTTFKKYYGISPSEFRKQNMN